MNGRRASNVVRFADFQLDLGAGELRKKGIRIRIPLQSIQLLEMLVAQPGEVVNREELQKKLWSNSTIVEFEHSINVAMNKLRQALGDTADSPRFIETLPRRGYRFIASVEGQPEASARGVAHESRLPEPFRATVVGSGHDAASISPGQIVAGRFRIARLAGRGGMSEVYEAHDIRLDRRVALKFLSDEFPFDRKALERFEREARAIAALNHPHICSVYDTGIHNQWPFIVMEYVEGETLEHRLKKGSLPLEQALRHATAIAGALDQAHRHGVIHRDLKPANIMLARARGGPTLKLLDFGLAKLRDSPATDAVVEGAVVGSERSENLTDAGTILGTVQYMAPEQLRGKNTDARTDIFSFGAVIFEMATGRRAFEADSRADLLVAILERDPVAISVLQPSASPALDHLVKTCLIKDPEARRQTANDVLLELRWIADGYSVAGIAVPLTGQYRNRERVAWGVAMLLVIGIFLAFLHVSQKPATTRAVRFSVLPPEKGSFGEASAISPDGTRLALIVAAPVNAPQLWVRRFDSLKAQPLAGTEGADEPFWSPDSQFIAFFSQGSLKRIDAAGGPTRTVCEACAGSRGTWNRDGVIVFGLNDVLYRVSSEGGPATPVTVLQETRHKSSHL
jgi:DNA-binding winged helix-turn-helix (wHTH) protein/tRNA A-37 threonylcarbamoyl transferase component Bud32